jgi:hypothetical protein
MTSNRLNGIYGPIALALLVVLFYAKVIFGHSIFVFVDASRFFYPLWKWGSDVLKQGWIPLWNPDAQFGTPYFADPQMAYAYPPVPLLYSWLSPLNAFAALTILHHFWALLGFWVFARHQGFSGKVSFLGSLVFGFSLHVVCSSWTPVALMAISWIPWIFFAVEKVLRGEKNGFLLLSLAWAMQFAAGYPVLTYLTTLAVLMEFAGRLLQQSKGRTGWFWSRFGVLAGSGAAALAYNLVWGLPFAELFRLSNYENGAGRFQDLGWLDLGTLLSPFDQGNPQLPGYHGPHYWVCTYFVGLPALCLLLWGVLRRTSRITSWVLFLVLLALSLGSLGSGPILRSIFPGYSLVIHSGYWLAPLVFWLARLAMESARGFIEKALTLEEGLLWAGVTGGIFLASLLVTLLLRAPFSAAPLVVSLALALIAPIFRSAGFRWSFLTLALAVSLGSAAFSINILMDKSYYEKPPATLADLPKPGRIFFTPPLLKEAMVLQGDDMEQAYEGAKERLYPNWPLNYEREEAPVYNTLQLKDSFDWTFKAFQYSERHSRKVLDYLGIRYLFGKCEFRDFKALSRPQGSVPIFENPTPLPKWYSVAEAQYCANFDDDSLRAEEAKMDYRKQCEISDCSKIGRYQSRPVVYALCGPDHVDIHAKGTGKALVVSSETAFPGWKVRVNGQERQVETINHSFRGVVLNDGETLAAFTFEPVTFRLGLFCWLCVCGFWMMLVLKTFLGRLFWIQK